MFSSITKLCKIKKRREFMFKILIIGIIIVVLSIMTINKGYAYKHSVDKLEDNPYTKKNKENS
ncbi:YtzI protein [Bacillus thuringiensis]|uniref:YtzI protein n=2 Tax=Bacillus cereus group TaxID=86661 RepID=A0A9X6KU33_BACTU|nr:YtzI protein [Bacillus thuringiensis serovar aizawai]OUA29389.1 YtzI protein [Bacillus thuringiensis]OTY96339.1 YtzI protein [Bacillus thuringiensis serovar aizawai]OTZ00850.1 YtzI protein [Bacillus thuringiensis serovar aizawai]OTZ03653.1 YtzI protein [Bacillus thuringiensis serovar aizawai]